MYACTHVCSSQPIAHSANAKPSQPSSFLHNNFITTAQPILYDDGVAKRRSSAHTGPAKQQSVYSAAIPTAQCRAVQILHSNSEKAEDATRHVLLQPYQSRLGLVRSQHQLQ